MATTNVPGMHATVPPAWPDPDFGLGPHPLRTEHNPRGNHRLRNGYTEAVPAGAPITEFALQAVGVERFSATLLASAYKK
jgi:hypothetical protein